MGSLTGIPSLGQHQGLACASQATESIHPDILDVEEVQKPEAAGGRTDFVQFAAGSMKIVDGARQAAPRATGIAEKSPYARSGPFFDNPTRLSCRVQLAHSRLLCRQLKRKVES